MFERFLSWILGFDQAIAAEKRLALSERLWSSFNAVIAEALRYSLRVMEGGVR